jgi:hypothetical protein
VSGMNMMTSADEDEDEDEDEDMGLLSWREDEDKLLLVEVQQVTRNGCAMHWNNNVIS